MLGAMMLAPGAIHAVVEILRPGDFYRESHGTIYTAALDLYGKGAPVDAITLADHLEERGELGEIPGDRGRIHELAALVPATANAAHYARIVKEMAVLRDLIRAGSEIAQLGWERPGDVPDLVDEAQQLAYELTPTVERAGAERLEQPVKDTFDRIAQLAETGVEIVGLPTGFHALDKVTFGFEPGNFVVVAARPSMGKSAFALAVAANIAIRQQQPAALFCLETSKRQVVQRLLASEARVELAKIRAPGKRLGQDEWARLARAADTLQKAPLYVSDKRGLTLVELRGEIRRLKMKEPNLACVIVDYLGLMRIPELRTDNRTELVTRIAQGLQTIAGDFDVPLIALSQLNRAVELRNDKRPQLSDLRDSGELEQSGDIVMFLYRDDYYNPDSETPGLTEVDVAKNRDGPTEKINLHFSKTYTAFTEVAR